MPTIDCGHWNGRRNRPPHLAGSIVWRSRWGRRFRLPVEADFHRSSKSRKRLCTLTGLGQRLADLLEVPNIGFVQCCRSLKRCVRVLCKQIGLVRIVETNGYIAFSKYLFQTWSNGPVPIDTVSPQIR